MLRKIFILAFLFASLTTWASDCSTIFPQLQIEDSIMKCRMDTLRLEQQPSVVAYEWSDGTTNPYYVIRSAEKIWVKLTDSIMDVVCYDTIDIHLFPTPEILTRLNVDTTLCFGDTLVLTVGEAENVYDLRWQIPIGTNVNYSADSSSITIVFDSNKLTVQNLTYEIIYTGYCTNWWEYVTQYTRYDSAFVFFVRPPFVELGPDTIYCDDGNGYKLIALSEHDFDISKYEFRWNDKNGTNQNTFTVLYDGRGTQFVNVWNSVCQKKDSVLYTATDTVDIDFWPHQWTNAHRLVLDTFVFCGGKVTLNAVAEDSNQTEYYWSGGNVDTTKINEPHRTVPSGSYTVKLRDSAGCERTFPVNVTEKSDNATVKMPNVFTPNNDGMNDFFKPIPPVVNVKSFDIQIYNRWGRKVHEFEGDPNVWEGWDGNNGNVAAPDGVYFWVVKYNDGCDKRSTERGSVTLLR
jgi:gliding motility-associated-like protein